MKTKQILTVISLFAVVLMLAILGGTWQATNASGTIPTHRPPTHTPRLTRTANVTLTATKIKPKPTKTVTPKPTKTEKPKKTVTPKPLDPPHCFKFLWWWICWPWLWP